MTVDAYFHTTVSRYGIEDFFQQLEPIRNNLEDAIRNALADWGVEARYTTLGNFAVEGQQAAEKEVHMWMAGLSGQSFTSTARKGGWPPIGHVFICYSREDSEYADRLQRKFLNFGISVWRDTLSLWPGQDWRASIRRAITSEALVFLACFSRTSMKRRKSYQYEEIALAIEQLRQHRPDAEWFIPVRLDDCEIPDLDIGGGRTLGSIQRIDIFGQHSDDQVDKLTAAVIRILGGLG